MDVEKLLHAKEELEHLSREQARLRGQLAEVGMRKMMVAFRINAIVWGKKDPKMTAQKWAERTCQGIQNAAALNSVVGPMLES